MPTSLVALLVLVRSLTRSRVDLQLENLALRRQRRALQRSLKKRPKITAIDLAVKEECLSRLILFGENSLRRALTQYIEHYHCERNHQGKANRILFPSQTGARKNRGAVRCRERLGGLLKYYEREAA